MAERRLRGTLPGMASEHIHPAVRVGHVHLRVADLDRALGFYRDALGFAVSADGAPPPPGHAGLYHVAFLYPDRRELGRAVRRLLDHGRPIDHATDHGGTVSVYLDDPDGNGVELYYDRPRADWFDATGRPILKNERFDFHDLLSDPTTTGA
jgi:catechol 2,3-dioxygenase